jgi:hypothetical protein
MRQAAFRRVGSVLLLALLVGDATGGLAGRLAGSLALAAAAVVRAQFARIKGDNSLHDDAFPSLDFYFKPL